MKKNLIVTGMAAALTFGLVGCGDGVDQDNGLSDGQQKDEIDQETEQDAKETIEQVEENGEEVYDEAKKELKENGIGDGIDQKNTPSEK
jgi:hypothetical protein